MTQIPGPSLRGIVGVIGAIVFLIAGILTFVDGILNFVFAITKTPEEFSNCMVWTFWLIVATMIGHFVEKASVDNFTDNWTLFIALFIAEIVTWVTINNIVKLEDNIWFHVIAFVVAFTFAVLALLGLLTMGESK